MKKHQLLLFAIAFFTFSYSQAQAPKSFPEDDAGFVQTLSTYIASNNRPESKEISEWIKSSLVFKVSPEDLKLVKQAAGVMLQKKVPLWPAYYNYMKLLRLMSNNTEISASNTSKNHQILLNLIQGGNSDAVKQFNFYVDYLTDIYPTKAFYVDKVKNWNSSSGYKVDIENGYPVYILDNTTLTGTTSTDTLQIFETSGKFYPFTNQWSAPSGKITWRRAGFVESDVFASFKSYTLDLSKPELNIDTVIFSFKPYVKNTIQGKFADKLFTSKAVANTYPQFTSFDKVPMQISNEVTLESGMGLEGIKMYATSTSRAEGAKLAIYNSKKVKIVDAEAKKFLIINFKQIIGEKTKVNFAFLDSTTSIFHPSSLLSYNIENKNLKITRENTNDAKIPFVAPYFKMNLYVDQFDWNIDSNYADMNSTAVNAKLPTIFESFEFYIEGTDSKYQQLLAIDPIGALASYCDNIGYKRISIDEIARAWNVSSYKPIEQLVFKLMEDGYLYYERETGMVDVYDKIFLHAAIRKDPENINYDNIKLSSLTQGKVGKLLIDQKKLEILGVEKAKLISSSNVTMNPTSDTVYISENRGIVFKGRLTAGKFNFYADSIQYDYEKNLFNLQNIDSMLVMVPLEQTDSKGNQYFTEINTPIEKISGKLYVSDPAQRNKSTRYTEYPNFDCNDTSVVTFHKTKFGDKYHPDSFKFFIYPFKVAQMNTIDTDSITFKGKLNSDGIFGDIETYLSITKDKTLGLNLSTDEQGMELYNGLGKLFGDITLDQEGLVAKGKITKENATFYSEEFTLFPDSLGANLSKMETTSLPELVYPIVNMDETSMNWAPANDSIYLSAKTDISLYQQQATLEGPLQIIQDKMHASGTLKIDESKFTSDSIHLLVQAAQIKNTPTAIQKNEYKVFTTGTADIEIDFDNLTATIQTPADSLSKFNFNYLLTNHRVFNWDVKNASISVDSTQPQDRYYEFVENKLKGIKLSASHSQFNEKTREIDLGGISQILVADSKVIPENAQLKITDGGLIDILRNATVILQSDSAFHQIDSAEVEILNKDMMKGSGVFVVQSYNDQTHIPIYNFKTIEETSGTKRNITTNYYTTASGEIDESLEFKLSEQLFYKGKLLLTSLDRGIELDGYAKTNFKKIKDTDWFKFKQSLDFKSSSFGIDSLKNEFNQDIYTGLMLDLNEMAIYPRIIQSKQSSTDRPLYAANGFMKSNAQNPEVKFGPAKTYNNKNPELAMMVYHDENETITFRGPFNLTENIAPHKALVYGNATYDPSSKDLFQINGSLALEMWTPIEINSFLNQFMTDLHINGTNVSLFKNRTHRPVITRLISDTLTQHLVQQDMDASGVLNLPTNFPYTHVFNDVNFYFDNMEGTFKSIDTLTMLVFAGKPYVQKITGFIEIGPRGKEDFFNIYLTTASGDWIFIRHNGAELSIVSSDAQLNTNISNMKEDKRSLKSGKTIVYKISVANPAIKDNFVSRMEDFKTTISQ